MQKRRRLQDLMMWNEVVDPKLNHLMQIGRSVGISWFCLLLILGKRLRSVQLQDGILRRAKQLDALI